MTIREYIDTIDEEERDEIAYTLYQISQDNYDDFALWAVENGVDLSAIDPATGEYVVVLWSYDQCGD